MERFPRLRLTERIMRVTFTLPAPHGTILKSGGTL